MHRMLQGVFSLEACHEVLLGNRAVGKVRILHQGLYYHLTCHCQIPSDQIYLLYAVSNSTRENLGVLVPEGDGFLLDKKIPAKRLGGETLRFEVSSGHSTRSGEFIPICPEEPFLYIDRLKTAFLQTEHGKVGIRIEKSPEAV